MSKTSRPLQIIDNEDGTSSISFNSLKPMSIRPLGNGKCDVCVANAIFEIDTTKDYLCMTAKEIATSIEGLDSGDIYREGTSIMVVD